MPTAEVCHQLEDSDPSLVVHDDVTEKVIDAALSLLKKPMRRVTNTDTSPLAGVPSLRSLLLDSSMPLADPVEVRNGKAEEEGIISLVYSVRCDKHSPSFRFLLD